MSDRGIKTVLAFAAVDANNRIEPDYTRRTARAVREVVASEIWGGTEAGTWAEARKMGWRVVKVAEEALDQ